ncbi:hypothetical protein A4A49_17904 [Nicotiana attenuata]|uniref:DUF4283 domain-containing protein n=1 Tax=Nicotiana attenuata TaxID=49451 RepID=A0A314KX58_NICAT|nr:hypothetical protein A4A49_17904 [Nicotiana attenuata]
MEKNLYHFSSIDEENIVEAPIAQACQLIASILQSKSTDILNSLGVRQNEVSTSGPNGPPPLIGNPSTTSKEQVCQVYKMSNMAIDHHDQLHGPVLHQLVGHGVLKTSDVQTLPQPHNQSKAIRSGPPLKVSTNFDKPNNSKRNHKPSTKNTEQAIQPNQQCPIITNANPQMAKAKSCTSQPPPPPPTVTHSYATRLRARQEAKLEPIEFSPPKITTKQGQPAVSFKRDDYMIKFADRCKFTVVGKFLNTMPRMEVIRRSFVAQAELKGGVKIAHFNARTVYIDLDNEYDHATVWGKQYMYIQGQMMKLKACTPAFKPNEDSPIVPISILGLSLIPKTRRSVAKVKMQIDLIKGRPHLVWLEYDEEQDENGDGEWLEVQYDSILEYCKYCRHQGHSVLKCEAKKKAEELQKRKEEENVAVVSNMKTNKGNTKEDAGTTKQQNGRTQADNQKPGTSEPKRNQQETEPQNQADHQNVDTESSKEKWQTQKKKYFTKQQETELGIHNKVWLPKDTWNYVGKDLISKSYPFHSWTKTRNVSDQTTKTNVWLIHSKFRCFIKHFKFLMKLLLGIPCKRPTNLPLALKAKNGESRSFLISSESFN